MTPYLLLHLYSLTSTLPAPQSQARSPTLAPLQGTCQLYSLLRSMLVPSCHSGSSLNASPLRRLSACHCKADWPHHCLPPCFILSQHLSSSNNFLFVYLFVVWPPSVRTVASSFNLVPYHTWKSAPYLTGDCLGQSFSALALLLAILDPIILCCGSCLRYCRTFNSISDLYLLDGTLF